MHSSRVAAICVLCVLATAMGCSSGEEQGDLIPVVFQSKWFPQAQFAGYYVAGGRPDGVTKSTNLPQDGGKSFYEAEGLDVTVVPGGDVNPSAEVAAGRASFGTDWIANFLTSIEKDQLDLVHISQVFQRAGYEFVAESTSGISTVAHFDGKEIGVWDFGNEFPAVVCFKVHNLTSDLDDGETNPDITTKTYAFDPALVFAKDLPAADKVDAPSVMVYNELNQVAGLGYDLVDDINRISAEDNNCALLEDFVFTSGELLKATDWQGSGLSGREIATRFLRATLRGWRWAVDAANLEQAVKVVLDYCGETCQGPASQTPEQHQTWQMRRVAELVQPGLLPGGKDATVGCLDSAAYDATLERLRDIDFIGATTGDGVTDGSVLTAAGVTCSQ